MSISPANGLSVFRGFYAWPILGNVQSPTPINVWKELTKKISFILPGCQLLTGCRTRYIWGSRGGRWHAGKSFISPYDVSESKAKVEMQWPNALDIRKKKTGLIVIHFRDWQTFISCSWHSGEPEGSETSGFTEKAQPTQKLTIYFSPPTLLSFASRPPKMSSFAPDTFARSVSTPPPPFLTHIVKCSIFMPDV